MSYPCAACCFRVQQCSVRFGSLMVLYASRDGIMPGSFCKRAASSAYHAWSWANIFVLHDLFLNVISTAINSWYWMSFLRWITVMLILVKCVELPTLFMLLNMYLNHFFVASYFFFFFFLLFYFRYMTFKCFNTVTSCKLVIFFPV